MAILIAILRPIFLLLALASAAPSTNIPWQPWSDAAFAEAKRDKKLIILDLEAVWCHWCHVMNEKTYGDAKVAELITKSFVAIRVDQDARPDISKRYENWGWPATIIFDSNGTELAKLSGYQEKEEFLTLLNKLVKDPKPEPDMAPALKVVAVDSPYLKKEQIDKLREGHVFQYDTKGNGWGRIHKFLFGNTEELALRLAATGNTEEETRVKTQLTNALKLIDPVWGGIYQYSVRTWDEPHFEKIAESQAKAIFLYSAAFIQHKDEAYKKAAYDVRRFLNTFFKDPAGGYYVSQDADAIPGKHSEGYFKLDDAARRKQGIPRIDTKVYSRENGLYAAALAHMYAATGDADVLKDAFSAIYVIETSRMLPNGGFKHGEKDKAATYLADSMEMARAYIQLYQVTGDRNFVSKAERTLGYIAKTFPHTVSGKTIGYLNSSVALAESLPPMPDKDENINLARIANLTYQYTGKVEHKQLAENAMKFVVNPEIVEKFPTAGTLLANEELTHDPVHITIVGAKDDEASKKLFLAALRYPATYKRIEWWDKSEGPLPRNDVTYPELAKAAAFGCTEGRCSLPIQDPDKLVDKLVTLFKPKTKS